MRIYIVENITLTHHHHHPYHHYYYYSYLAYSTNEQAQKQIHTHTTSVMVGCDVRMGCDGTPPKRGLRHRKKKPAQTRPFMVHG